jgi:hypothetical protein
MKVWSPVWDRVDIPSFKQAFDFFKRKGIFCWVQPNLNPHGEPRENEWVINIYRDGEYVYDLNKIYKTERQAQIACIRQCIKLLK